jgi:hypothetical protein
LQISPYPLRSAARFHIRAQLSLKGEVGCDLPTLKKPFSGRFSAHLLLKGRFSESFGYTHPQSCGLQTAIFAPKRPSYLLKSRFSTAFSFIDLLKGSSHGAILSSAPPLLCKKPVFEAVFIHLVQVRGLLLLKRPALGRVQSSREPTIATSPRKTDGRRTVGGRSAHGPADAVGAG